MTCGMGNFGSALVSSLAKDLRLRLTHGDTDWRVNPKAYTVAEIAEKAKKFFEEKFDQIEPKPESACFEFWIGGYPSDLDLPYELWKVEIAHGTCLDAVQIGAPGSTGVSWAGAPDAINRLVTGFDGTLIQGIRAIVAAQPGNKSSEEVETQVAGLHDFLKSETQVFLDSPMMPIQDAIDLADFLVETTKRFYRFLPGADIVGGDTDIAVVTRHEGFKWISRKHFYPSNLNPLETDHA
jgi:hypothetical protein